MDNKCKYATMKAYLLMFLLWEKAINEFIGVQVLIILDNLFFCIYILLNQSNITLPDK